MIFTERKITISNNASSIDKQIVLYRGDKNVEIRFTISEFPFKYSRNNETNVIESTEASFGQLVIKVPNDKAPIFSDIVPTKKGSVVFTITGEMIDEISELGTYDFQIRLFDEEQNSRATIPPIEKGIEIREPIATEDVSNTNEVGVAVVNYAVTTAASDLDAFDENGNYIKTSWSGRDLITSAKLNKIEAGIDGVNQKVASGGTGSNNASDISITDTANNFTSTNVEGALAEVSSQIKDIVNSVGGGNVSGIEPENLDMPKVFFYGDALPTTKNDVLLTMDYISNTDKFSAYIKLKCQGTSSMSYDKKNFTINMYSDEARETKLNKNFKGWGNQSKFCLKANWVDTTHTRNISGARIAYDMVQSRPDSTFKQQLLTAPRYGLVDGFPIKLYFNGEFYGIYTWNIPKDGWMFNMDSSNPNHIVLCAEQNTNGNSSLINSCQFRQLWNGTDGGDWSYEFGTPSNTVKDSLNRCIGFVMNATDQEFHDNIGQYFDLYSLLDYYCFSYLCCHLDGLAKNMLMVTYDGVIWGASLYDMDSIYGVHWNGNSYVATNYQCPEQYQEQFSRLWVRIEQCFATELYTRYLELRQGALSLSNIIKHVEEIYDVIPDRVFADEKAKWTDLPQVSTNTMTRFRNYMRDRVVYVDAQMAEIGTKVDCTGITLSANNLSFTTKDAQTLTVTKQPSNTTDVVTWSVSPTGVVTVNNGVVTPVANGDCTITATCGTQSATCAVNVALPVVACTSIRLDKTELTLSSVETDLSTTNLLENVSFVGTTGDIYSEGIVLTPGQYHLSNINDGAFTWLGYKINDRNYINGTNSTDAIDFYITREATVNIKIYSSNASTINGNISLTKTSNITINAISTPFEYESDGAINNSSSTDCDVAKTVNLDSAKSYILRLNDVPTSSSKYLCTLINYSDSTNNLQNWLSLDDQGCSSLGIISNATSIKISYLNNRLTDLELVEITSSRPTSIITKLTEQLTATVEPSNTTDTITWSTNAENIATVNNGLVTAKANGSAVITATCGSQSATCNVTVSGLNEEPTLYTEQIILQNYVGTGSKIENFYGGSIDFTTQYIEANIDCSACDYSGDGNILSISDDSSKVTNWSKSNTMHIVYKPSNSSLLIFILNPGTDVNTNEIVVSDPSNIKLLFNKDGIYINDELITSEPYGTGNMSIQDRYTTYISSLTTIYMNCSQGSNPNKATIKKLSIFTESI